jgi:lysophospholipase L1-like esterase
VSATRRASRIVATAAVGGAAVGGGGLGMLWAQSMLARRRVGDPRGEPFFVDGTYGAGSGPVLRMVVLGDSGAAGLGADAPQDTVAVLVAQGVAAASGRLVELVSLAVVGAQTGHLAAQVEGASAALGGRQCDLVVVMIGANDVTHRVRPQVSVRQLREVVAGLVEQGTAVVVGCCPDLGTVQPVPNPLRTVGRRLSRTLAAAQAMVTAEAGGHPVELGSLLGAEFAARPGEYFSEDRFHPSSVGYRRLADELLPAALAALRLPVRAGHDARSGSADPPQADPG